MCCMCYSSYIANLLGYVLPLCAVRAGALCAIGTVYSEFVCMYVCVFYQPLLVAICSRLYVLYMLYSRVSVLCAVCATLHAMLAC